MTAAQFDFDSIVANTLIDEVRYLDSTSSTNDFAKDWIRGEKLVGPRLVIASHQFAGRGRLGKDWWSGSGSLMFSIVFDASQVSAPGLLSFAAAISVAEAIETVVGADKPKLKWPNDVFIRGRKVAGVLIESICNSGKQIAIIGIGVNTNCQLSNAPSRIRCLATSLRDEFNQQIDHQKYLTLLLNCLARNIEKINTIPTELTSRFCNSSLFSVSTVLTIESAGQPPISGQFTGFGTQGQLLLKNGSETLEIVSGSIDDYC